MVDLITLYDPQRLEKRGGVVSETSNLVSHVCGLLEFGSPISLIGDAFYFTFLWRSQK